MSCKVTEIRLEFPDDHARAKFEKAFQSWLKTYQSSQQQAGVCGESDVHRIGYGSQAQDSDGSSPELIYVDFIPGF